MPPKRRTPANHDHEELSDDVVSLKRAQIAAWRQVSDPTPCSHTEPLVLAWYKESRMIGEPYELGQGDLSKRGDHFKKSDTVDGYVIFCPRCDMWLAIGEKWNGIE